MKFFTFMLVLMITCGAATTVNASENDNPDSAFDGVLKRYVSKDGLVNYKELKEDKEFNRYIEYLSTADTDKLPSNDHRLAFWINAYNAFVLKGVLDEYPIKSVLDVGWLPHSFFMRKTSNTNSLSNIK